EATGPGGAVVTYTATATDNLDPSPVLTCTPASGSTFPIATTTVTCNAHDVAGNNATPKTFTIKVQDTTGPAVTVPANITDTTTSAAGKVETFTATATDLVDGSRPVTCTPASGSTFPVGTTTVNCTATDTRGNSTSRSFTVTITLLDGTPPVITVPA